MLESELQRTLDELSDRMADAVVKVTNLLEAEDKPHGEVEGCNDLVNRIADAFATILAHVPEEEREAIDRTLGRRVTDLRRVASRLPQMSPGRAVKTIVSGQMGWDDYYHRADVAVASLPKPPGEAPRVITKQGNVGGDVEAWCGPCGGLRYHTIVAVVNKEPKHVLCQSCGGKHGYRTTPARKGKAAATSTTAGRARQTRAGAEDRRREEARTALQKELAEAPAIRPFVLRQRYKVGEIIQHPELGRGKIENVLKGSLLVRFRDGLKSVNNL